MASPTIEERMDALAPTILLAGVNKSLYINMASERTAESAFSESYDQAIALRALHLIQSKKDADTGGGSGFITSKKEKNVALTVSSIGGVDDLSTTKWGQQLQNLIDDVIVGMRTSDV